jgi:histidine triad (HIT) family protein
VEVPRDVAVDPIGRAERGEQPRCSSAVVAAEEEPHEDGQRRESSERDHVRHGEDAVLAGELGLVHQEELYDRPMPTIFTRIIQGELPGRFVWRDDRVVAFLPIALLARGHTLVVPIQEVDHWVDLDADLNGHMWEVARVLGRALDETFQPSKVGVLVVGEEVPHVHVHLVPFRDLSQMNFANQDTNPDPAMLDGDAERIRAALRTAGHGDHVPA